ncbi:MAG: fibronectin type III domain-containing protein [Bacteroidota bacterium]
MCLLACFLIYGNLSYAQTKEKIPKEEQVQKKEEEIKNDPQPTRYNYKRLSRDKNSPFYNPNGEFWPEDNVEERAEFNFNRIKDPRTGQLPENIRERELRYVRSPRARLLPEYNTLGQEGDFIKRGAGDQTSSWVNRGPFNVGGRTRALAIDINNEDILLAGGVSGGMWRTTDQGTTWTRVTTADQHPTVTDVKQDTRPGFQDTWYYTTGERIGASQSARNGAAFLAGNGIYKSTDNGVSWSVLPATVNTTPQSFSVADPFDLIFGIEVHPTTGDLYVATFAGIYRSTNGGTSFDEVLTAEFDNFSDIHISNTGVIYAALDAGGAVGGIYRTTDGAAGTWTNITDPGYPTTFARTVIHTAPSNPDVLYVFSDGTPTAPVGHDLWKYTYVSGDGSGAGGTWEDRSANLPAFGGPVGSFDSQGGYDLYVRVHPTDENMVFLGGTNIYRSTDGYATSSGVWIAGYSPLNNVSLYTNHHPDQHSLEFFPSNPDKVVSGHDGGVSITQDITTSIAGIEPVAWTSLNNGYLTTQVYALSIGPGDQLMSGFQDNSTWFTNNDTPDDPWVDVFSGDGSYNAFNDEGDVRYLSSQRGNVFRRTYASANSATPLTSQGISPAQGLFVAPFELDPNNDERMYYAAANTLWRNDNLLSATTINGWTQLTNAAASANVSALAVSELPSNIVYFGTTAGEVFKINNANVGNPSAVDIFTGKGLPGGNVASIDINAFDANDVVITFSNYSIPSIWRTTDGGNTWTDISGNLEENPDGTGSGPSVRWVARVGNNDRYFAGTSTGLYSTTAVTGATTVWTQESVAGFRNMVVEQVRIRDEDGLVVIGTHGNGLFSAAYETSQPLITVVNAIDPVVVEENSPATNINVGDVFQSNEDPPLAITVTVSENSNTSLLNANVNGNTLVLDYLPDVFGQATITLQGEDTDGNTAFFSFSVTVTPGPIDTFPYVIDFETGDLPIGWEATGVVPWVINSGGTASGGTGPLVDHTIGDATGSYIYTEVSGPNPGDEAILISRAIDLSTVSDPAMEFWYHMFGPTIGTLELDIVDVTNGDTTTVFTLTGQQQLEQDDPYLGEFNIDLDPFTESVIRLIFRGTRGSSFTGDIAIDDISVFQRPADDIGVSAIELDGAPFYSPTQTVNVVIENFGTATQTGFEVSYILDGGTPVTETFTGSLAGKSNTTYSFTTTADLSTSGGRVFQAATNLSGDVNLANDTSQLEITVAPVISAYPYIEDFESGVFPDGWTSEGIVQWIVNSGGTTSTGTGPLVDNTLGSAAGSYIYSEMSGPALGDEGIFTTGGFNISSLTAPVLDFWYHMAGGNVGTLMVDVIDITNQTETTIFEISGAQQDEQGDPYINTGFIDLADFRNSIIQLKFTAIRADGFDGDIAIDDIKVGERPATDVGVVAIAQRNGNVFNDNEELEVTIVNFGLDDQSNFEVSFEVNGAGTVTETISSTIPSLDTLVYTFSTGADLSIPGDYVVTAFTNLAGDETPANDASSISYQHFPAINTFPYIQDFDGTNSIDNWQFDGEVVTWTVDALGTPSPNTGPVADHTSGTGFYIYSEVSGSTQGDQAFFVTDPFDLSGLTEPVMEFWYHMFGANIGTLDVIVVDALTGDETPIFSISGQQQNEQGAAYKRAGFIELIEFTDPIQLKFVATAGASFLGDIAIDDIRILERPADDIGVVEINLVGEFTNNKPIEIVIENFGTEPQTNFNVTYRVDSETPVTEVFTQTINGNSVATYTFNAAADLSLLDEAVITASTDLVGDADAANDELSKTFKSISIVSDFPYSESFESGSGNWGSEGAINSWELGQPANSVISSAADGTEAWVTNLDGAYQNDEESFVKSPAFDLSGLTNPFLKLDVIGNSEIDFDGANIQYSTNLELSWSTLGSFQDPDNWYTSESLDGLVFFGSVQGWDTTDGSGWVTAIHPLEGLAGESSVLLRIAFGADGGTTDEGFGFDNVNIFDLIAPASISVASATTSTLNLTWDAVPGVDTYIVDVSEDNFSTFVSGYEAFEVTGSTLEVTGLSPLTTYQFRVRSVAGSYETDNTTGEGSTLELEPNAPTQLVVSQQGDDIVLTWSDNASNETGFTIERSEEGGSFAEIGQVAADVLTFTDDNATVGVDYTYRVAAFNATGNSDYSNEATFVIVGLEDDILKSGTSLSPNPSNGIYQVSIDDTNIQHITLQVSDLDGKLILSRSFERTSDLINFQFDITKEAKGMYIMRLDTDDGRFATFRIVKK